MKILPFLLLAAAPLHAAPVHLVPEKPAALSQPAPGVWLVDFGNATFGNVELSPPAGATAEITVHFGESLKDSRIDRKPPGTVRYATAKISPTGKGPLRAAPPADARNTKQPAAVLTPPEWGVVLPFRWVEIEGWQGKLEPAQIVRKSAFAAAWDDSESAFHCSDATLDGIWELCKLSIKATTFAGVYVDGDRERIPYEADAYLNQLSHYATGTDVEMARDTFDRLMKQPTWPTEWAPHMVFMAHADWMRTGDAKWLGTRYDSLKSKILADRVGKSGLVESNKKQISHDDIVDWPTPERDGYVFTKTNTVVNAFHIAALGKMAELADGLGKSAEAADFRKKETTALAAFDKAFLISGQCLYRDGEGTDHSSLHANLFPLAFGLTPEECREKMSGWLAARGMKCSVYAAQYLLEGLFQNGRGDDALKLMTTPGDRSWRHMLESGTTMTWEAWDMSYKPNQDWNHAWGAAPANLLPRFVLGAEPLEPGWKRCRIRPSPGGLGFANGKIPTPRGPVLIDWKSSPFRLSLKLPPGMTGKLELPAAPDTKGVLINGNSVPAKRAGDRWLVEADVTGIAKIEVR